jgi:hypothetical protein
VDDFWKNIPEMDAEFEANRKNWLPKDVSGVLWPSSKTEKLKSGFRKLSKRIRLPIFRARTTW